MTDDAPRIRLRIIGVVAISLFVALIARLYFLQIMNSQSYEQQAVANIQREVRVPAPRGRIFDAKGNLLVDNKVITVVSIDKAGLERALPAGRKPEERREMLTRLAVEISRSGRLTKVADIETALKNSQYAQIGEVPVALDVDKDLVVYIGERPDEFPGVKISQTTVRDYRYGTLAAHVLGYVGRINDTEYRERADSPKKYDLNDQIGKTGVEKLFEDDLRGTPGTRVYEVDNRERPIREVAELNHDPVPGNDIYLTIDIDLQRMTEDELRGALEQARTQPKLRADDPDPKAPAGAAVILDPRNGSVRAMASYPTYDPSEFISGISQSRFAYLNDPATFQPILNRAIQGEYAPGSTFKLFTAYAALENGFMGTGILPGVEQKIQDNGVFKLTPCEGKCEWSNSLRADGTPTTAKNVDLRKSLTVSSDTYFYAIGTEIGRSKTNDRAIQNAAEAFGLGRSTGVALPNERSGLIPDRALKQSRHDDNPKAFPEGRWNLGDNINVSVGQGDTLVTPIQLANAYATFANGGTNYAPNVVSRVVDPHGTVVRSIDAREIEKVDMPAAVRNPILDGLVGVTSWRDPASGEAGTAWDAFHRNDVGAAFDLDRWPIMAKTGTAQVNGKADTALFAAVGPSVVPSNPATAGNVPEYAMVVVLEQSGFGGANAAPVAAKVLNAAFTNTLPHAMSTSESAACTSMRDAASATTTTPADRQPLVLDTGVVCP
jgi:penicillin-binding protein 2